MPDNRPHNDPYDESSWSSPDPFFVGDDDIRPGVDYSNLPGDSESISSDWFRTSTPPLPNNKATIIPIVIIAFVLYKFL